MGAFPPFEVSNLRSASGRFDLFATPSAMTAICAFLPLPGPGGNACASGRQRRVAEGIAIVSEGRIPDVVHATPDVGNSPSSIFPKARNSLFRRSRNRRPEACRRTSLAASRLSLFVAAASSGAGNFPFAVPDPQNFAVRRLCPTYRRADWISPRPPLRLHQ